MISPAIVLRGGMSAMGKENRKFNLHAILNDLIQIPNWLWRLTNLGCDKLLYRHIPTNRKRGTNRKKNNETDKFILKMLP